MKINDLNRIALGINTARGINIISLGFRLRKKPDKTPEEEAAAIRQQRVVALMIAMGGCVAGLVIFAIIARATFGKPWYRWVASIRG